MEENFGAEIILLCFYYYCILFLLCVAYQWYQEVARFIRKDSDAGRDWGQEEKGTTEDEMPGWHH